VESAEFPTEIRLMDNRILHKTKNLLSTSIRDLCARTRALLAAVVELLMLLPQDYTTQYLLGAALTDTLFALAAGHFI
jgi:hypothetical protein